MADRDILADARDLHRIVTERESHNRTAYVEDFRFARLAEQWPEDILRKREKEGRPVLTINRIIQFLRQVINDSRLNRPSITVKPVDYAADPRTATVYNGLIRNIEVSSKADIAYDTAIDCAVTGGFGYSRVDLDYTRDDTFDLDINVNRIINPLTVYGDPDSIEADSSDWSHTLVSEKVRKDAFKAKYGKAKAEGFDFDNNDNDEWISEDEIRVAEYWVRSVTPKTILKLSSGIIISEESYLKNESLFVPAGITVEGSREINGYKVMQYLLTGAEVLKETPWPGRFIPIVPTYGDEVNIEGKRHLISLIRHSKDAQRMFNYWRSAGTELVALAPRVPFVGPKGFAKSDPNWETANTESHPYLEYDGQIPPQRQPLDSGAAAGALQEAMNAADDMKAIMGIYDASLGARSNETSGRAIIARQREGDVSTFHFADNLTRTIRHIGSILVDLIPHVYSGERIVRVLGEDGKPEQVRLGTPVPQPDGTQFVYDLSVGKYDVVVRPGPSFTTRREEAASQMIEFVRNYPPAAPVMGDVIARAQDWPEADKIEQRLIALMPPHVTGKGPSPQEQQMMQQIQQMQQQLQQLMQENQKLQAQLQDKSGDMYVKDRELQNDDRELTLKEQEMLLKARELESEALALQEQLNQAQTEAGQMAQSMQQMMAQMQEAMLAFSQPKFKTGKAVKLDDGTWELSAVEQTGTIQ